MTSYTLGLSCARVAGDKFGAQGAPPDFPADAANI